MKKVCRSMEEFYKKYLGEEYKRYPIAMRLSEEEAKWIEKIRYRRWNEKD